jgi:hypothetical protein
LNHDVAQHLIRLNKIRQAVPALRKGQWTTDGCKATGKNGNNQTGNFDFVNGAVYNRDGKTNESVSTGINQVGSKKAPAKLKIYSTTACCNIEPSGNIT